MKKIIVITGTPGTGKTTITGLLLKKLRGAKAYDVNSLVEKYRLYSGKDEFGVKIVKIKELEDKIREIIKSQKGSTIIFDGHILSDIKIPGATAIVLREHLNTLIKRLKKRNYPTEKIRDNIVSEAIDYCGTASRLNYKNSFEIMSGKGAALEILSIIRGNRKKLRETPNLLPELVEVIKKRREFAL